MVLTSSRILSCGVWLILMRKTSAPASNSRRIMALSEEAGPSVARILIRRRRLMAWFRVQRLAADQTPPETLRPANWTGEASRLANREGFRALQALPFPGFPAPVVRAVRWIRSIARSRRAAHRY